MLGLIAFAYLLLAMRVRICIDVSLSQTGGSLRVSAAAGGVMLRYDGAILHRGGGWLLSIVPRYGDASRQNSREKESRKSLHIARKALWLAQTGVMERLFVHMRIGLGDAGETALAAGGLRALASAAFLRFGGSAQQELRVTPDFEAACFAAHGRCIFSCQAGDIMLAVLKAAVRKSGKEGFWWKSTPLKA